MIDAGSLEFAHARIWARLGQQPDDALWRRIEATRGLGAVFDLARGSSLACWLAGVGPAADVHAIDHAARRHWRARVAEVAAWMPPAWGRAIDWCGVLVDLPALQHLARGRAALPWMADDEALRGLADGTLPAGTPLRALLEAARAEPERVLSLWRTAWQRLLPRGCARQAVESQLVPLLSAHAAAFGAAHTLDGWALRRHLHSRLMLLLRRAVAEPATAFIYLALSALEFERIRGELLLRAAFPQRSPAP